MRGKFAPVISHIISSLVGGALSIWPRQGKIFIKSCVSYGEKSSSFSAAPPSPLPHHRPFFSPFFAGSTPAHSFAASVSPETHAPTVRVRLRELGACTAAPVWSVLGAGRHVHFCSKTGGFSVQVPILCGPQAPELDSQNNV